MNNITLHEDGSVVWDDSDAYIYKETLLYNLKIMLSKMDNFAMNSNTHCLKHGKMQQMQDIINYIENKTI